MRKVVCQGCYRGGGEEVPPEAPYEAMPPEMIENWDNADREIAATIIGAFAVPGLASAQQALADSWLEAAYNWPENVKIESLTANMQPKVLHVLAALRAKGWQPRMFNGFRHPMTQRAFYADGRSKVEFSRHNGLRWVPTGEGTGVLLADAYATDITDPRYNEAKASDVPTLARFYKDLKVAANAVGLASGADYAKWKEKADGTLEATSKWSAYGLGWDPLHIEDTSKSVKALQTQTYDAIDTAEAAGSPQIYAGMPPTYGPGTALAGLGGLVLIGAVGALAYSATRKR